MHQLTGLHPARSMLISGLRPTVLMRSLTTLYNRRDDPDQVYNLFGHRAVPGLRGQEKAQRELHELTLAWLDYFDDPFPDQLQLWDFVESETVPPIQRMHEDRNRPRGARPH